MADYEPLMIQKKWFAEFTQSVDEIVAEHRSVAGPELIALQDVFCLLNELLREVWVNDPSLATAGSRPKVALIAHTLHLLLSTLDAGLRGRMSAAFNNLRSIGESPSLLLHMNFWPKTAMAVLEGTVKDMDSYEVVAKVANRIEQDQPGEGEDWKRVANKWANTVQEFSHLSRTAMLASLGQKDGNIAIGPIGVVDADRFRGLVTLLLSKGLEILHACTMIFPHPLVPNSQWLKYANQVIEQAAPVVTEMQRNLLGPSVTEAEANH